MNSNSFSSDNLRAIQQTDPEIYQLIRNEEERQREGLEMIASENYTSVAVMQAQGSVLTNKYAEGYPGKRYYGGCEFVDGVESLAIQRACELFQCKFANVQAHSGSQANMAVMLALLKPGDRILGMDLSHGGHLTHGSSVNFSGLLFQAHSYGLDADSGLLNMEQVEAKARDVRPQLIIAGYSAYPRPLDFERFRKIADAVGAYLLVDMAHFAGLVASGAHASPFPHAHVVTSTTHKTLRGPRGGLILTNEEEIAKKVNSRIFPGIQGGPLEHIIAAKAIAFKEALSPNFKKYIERVVQNAQALAENLKAKGWKLVTGGTENHLLLLDLSETPVSGKQAETALDRASITVNKNTVPNEKRSPFVTSGIRIGSPALTTRGMGPEEMQKIANWISAVLKDPENEALQQQIRQEVQKLCEKFPVPSVPAR